MEKSGFSLRIKTVVLIVIRIRRKEKKQLAITKKIKEKKNHQVILQPSI
jgi:hypothetical protein